jgi:hypothetical protein
MSYTAICDKLKAERIAADNLDMERAKDVYGDGFDSTFGYRRGGERFVRNKPSAVAKCYRRSLHTEALL